jgi:curved DNA-binding protein CbpA
MKDYYQILGLPFGASMAEIKSAYRKLAFLYHPDKNAGNKIAQEKFVEITEAHTVLTSKDKSYLYHVEYTDFLSNKKSPREATIQDYHKDPKKYPRHPKAPASKRELDKKGVISAVLIFTVIFIISFFMRKRLPEERLKNQKTNYETTSTKDAHALTKDEYYKILAQDFEQTHDSALMKIENVDSVIHILDSLINMH